jgi:hypothetical protein
LEAEKFQNQRENDSLAERGEFELSIENCPQLSIGVKSLFSIKLAIWLVSGSHDANTPAQNCSLAPNWIWREVVEVAVTTPAVGEIPDVADV